eukprot:Rhum_TRINITY_DN14982_c16_g1::Rhum_TRINITY_DN14982_c16_g1_i1::g.131301::m.131301
MVASREGSEGGGRGERKGERGGEQRVCVGTHDPLVAAAALLYRSSPFLSDIANDRSPISWPNKALNVSKCTALAFQLLPRTVSASKNHREKTLWKRRRARSKYVGRASDLLRRPRYTSSSTWYLNSSNILPAQVSASPALFCSAATARPCIRSSEKSSLSSPLRMSIELLSSWSSSDCANKHCCSPANARSFLMKERTESRKRVNESMLLITTRRDWNTVFVSGTCTYRSATYFFSFGMFLLYTTKCSSMTNSAFDPAILLYASIFCMSSDTGHSMAPLAGSVAAHESATPTLNASVDPRRYSISASSPHRFDSSTGGSLYTCGSPGVASIFARSDACTVTSSVLHRSCGLRQVAVTRIAFFTSFTTLHRTISSTLTLTLPCCGSLPPPPPP